MTVLFYLILLDLIFAELLKGLSANGTPPILARYLLAAARHRLEGHRQQCERPDDWPPMKRGIPEA